MLLPSGLGAHGPHHLHLRPEPFPWSQSGIFVPSWTNFPIKQGGRGSFPAGIGCLSPGAEAKLCRLAYRASPCFLACSVPGAPTAALE